MKKTKDALLSADALSGRDVVLLVHWLNHAAAYPRNDFLAVGEVRFVRDTQLGRGFPHPLAVATLDRDAGVSRIDGESGEEAVTIGASVFDPAELGMYFRGIAFVAVGPTNPLVGGRVDMKVGNLAGTGNVVDVCVSVDCQQNLVCRVVE